MNSKRAEIVTAWTVVKDADGRPVNSPQLAREYPLVSWSDVTGQPAQNIPTDPNLVVLEVTGDDSVIQQIRDDANYVVLWSGGGDRIKPVPRSEWDQMRQFLAARGLGANSIDEALGTAPTNRPRHLIAQRLKSWLRARPGGGVGVFDGPGE